MGRSSRISGDSTTTTRTTTADHPFVMESPTIGFLNLQGDSGALFMENDSRELSSLFHKSVTSTLEIPTCEVLFLYCHFTDKGQVGGTTHSLRDIFKNAGAYIAVVASENDPDVLFQAVEGDAGWSSNIVLVLDRKGDKCPTFFRRLFEKMQTGTSMLMAWVELVPQIPGYDHKDAPETVMLAEAGHVTFRHDG